MYYSNTYVNNRKFISIIDNVIVFQLSPNPGTLLIVMNFAHGWPSLKFEEYAPNVSKLIKISFKLFKICLIDIFNMFKHVFL